MTAQSVIQFQVTDTQLGGNDLRHVQTQNLWERSIASRTLKEGICPNAWWYLKQN